MALLYKTGKTMPKQVAINHSIGDDHVNERPEFRLEIITKHGQISRTLMLSIEEAGELREQLQHFLATLPPGTG